MYIYIKKRREKTQKRYLFSFLWIENRDIPVTEFSHVSLWWMTPISPFVHTCKTSVSIAFSGPAQTRPSLTRRKASANKKLWRMEATTRSLTDRYAHHWFKNKAPKTFAWGLKLAPNLDRGFFEEQKGQGVKVSLGHQYERYRHGEEEDVLGRSTVIGPDCSNLWNADKTKLAIWEAAGK